MSKPYLKRTPGFALLFLLTLSCSTSAQTQPANFQQQVKNSFNQAKNRVSSLFSRRQQPTPPTQQGHQYSQQQLHPQQQMAHAHPMTYPHSGQNHSRQQPGPNIQNQWLQQPGYERQSPYAAQHVAYQQQPQPDPNTRQYDSNFGSNPQTMSGYPETGLPQIPAAQQRAVPQMNPGAPNQIVADGWETQSTTNYQNYLRSNNGLRTKPPSLDHYNERQYQHFSNRISATERAIILEDELAKIKEEKKTLESDIRSLESKLKQRDYEISQLQTAIDDAIQQLSTATNRHSELQEKIRVITELRNQERAASNKLLEELHRQLNDLLANELIGSG